MTCAVEARVRRELETGPIDRSSESHILGQRSIGSGLGLWVVSKYLWRTRHYSAGDGDGLASRRLPIVLALEVEASTDRPAVSAEPPTDPRHEHCEPAMGARDRCRADQRAQIHGAEEEGPPSRGWKTFLHNHADGFAAMDLFVVPTVSFQPLNGLLIMGHSRRRILWLGEGRQATRVPINDRLLKSSPVKTFIAAFTPPLLCGTPAVASPISTPVRAPISTRSLQAPR